MKETVMLNNIDSSDKETNEKQTNRLDFKDFTPLEMLSYFDSLSDDELEEKIDKILDDESMIANFSYWEKYLDKEKRMLVDEIVAKKKGIYGAADGLPLNLEKKFNESEIRMIANNLGAIQLTFGCSKGCPFCAFDALPGIREAIPYSQLANFFQEYGQDIRKGPMLYWASEPSDYADSVGLEDKTYHDVHQLAVNYSSYSPHITSREFSKSWVSYLGDVGSSRVSIYNLKETNVLDLNNQIKQINDSFSNSEEKRIKLVGENSSHERYFGQNYYKLSAAEKGRDKRIQSGGIGCFNGFMLSPRGLYNIVQIHDINDKYPQGQSVVPFKKFENKPIEVGFYLEDVLPYYSIEYDYFPRYRKIILKGFNNTKTLISFDESGKITTKIDCDYYETEKACHFIDQLIKKNNINDIIEFSDDLLWFMGKENESRIKSEILKIIKDTNFSSFAIKNIKEYFLLDSDIKKINFCDDLIMRFKTGCEECKENEDFYKFGLVFSQNILNSSFNIKVVFND